MFRRKELLARIEALEAQVRRLENMHATIIPREDWEIPSFISFDEKWVDKYYRLGHYNDRQLTGAEIEHQPHHPQPVQVDYKRITNIPSSAVDTNRIPKVTLEELARLIIDGTPIKRQEEISAKRISEYTEDTTTTITVTE